MTYLQEVKAARERYETAVEEAEEGGAADALRIAEEYGKPVQTVCKEIAGSRWQSLQAKAKRYQRDPRAAARENMNRQMRGVRALAKADPEAVAQALAKVNPQTLIDVATQQQGRTRSSAPSNKAKVEQAFGPAEFNKLEDAADDVLERLPDLAPNPDDVTYANELADKIEGVAGALRAWARGESVAEEVEQWLRQA